MQKSYETRSRPALQEWHDNVCKRNASNQLQTTRERAMMGVQAENQKTFWPNVMKVRAAVVD